MHFLASIICSLTHVHTEHERWFWGSKIIFEYTNLNTKINHLHVYFYSAIMARHHLLNASYYDYVLIRVLSLSFFAFEKRRGSSTSGRFPLRKSRGSGGVGWKMSKKQTNWYWKPLYVFSKPLYDEGFPPLANFRHSNPILMDRTLTGPNNQVSLT